MKVLLKMVCVNHRNANYFYYHKGQAKDARGRIQLLGWNFGLWVFPNAGEHLEGNEEEVERLVPLSVRIPSLFLLTNDFFLNPSS